MKDPYDKCPVLETEHFILRLIKKYDAEDLFECYSDVNSQRYFNSDNCTTEFTFKTLDEMNRCIDSWLSEYENKKYIRFSIVYKITGKVIGTIEIFGGKYGVLRVDIKSEYEKQEHLKEIIEVAVNNFFTLFKINRIITKAIPEAIERRKALMDYGFIENTKKMKPFKENYFCKDIEIF